MPSRPRQKTLLRRRRQAIDASQLARINPDALARNLQHWPRDTKSHALRCELWHLLQNLGSDAVIKRAAGTIERSRMSDELDAVLHAAAADSWTEVSTAIVRRFHREVKRLHASTPSADLQRRIESLVFAAGRLNAPLAAADIRVLLKHSSARLRTAGAEICARERREELLNDALPLCWERGEAGDFAGELVARCGDAGHAATLWSRALTARRAGRLPIVRRLVHILAEMGTFDIQLAVKIWIEEDFANPHACAWSFAQPWSRLVAAKLAAGACSQKEAVGELLWFINAAGSDPTRGFGGYGAEKGPCYIARQLVLLGASSEAESLLKRYHACGLPPPEQFPELLFPSLREFIGENPDGAAMAWLAAMGDAAAQEKLVQGWFNAFSEARWPEHWAVRQFLDSETVLAVLRESLHVKEPGTLRQVLALLMGDSATQALKPEIERLASRHSSTVVRWKARRVLKAMKTLLKPCAESERRLRWVRLDAAVLSGAIRPNRVQRAAGAQKPPEKIGVLPPARSGSGYRLEFEDLAPAARRATEKALCRMSVAKQLDRRVPLGPAFEDRPDIRAVRELAPPGNEIDERMQEMASAVMNYWSDGDDVLTLDEEGVALVATGLSADVRVLDEDDVLACGAFVGEALRKRLGGNWAGYDDNYVLEINGVTVDPIGWAKQVYAKKDIVEGTQSLVNEFVGTIQKLDRPARRHHYHPDPSEAFEKTIQKMNALPLSTPMAELLAEARVMSYRLEAGEWPSVLSAMDPLLYDAAGVRTIAAFAVYSPAEAFARAWSRWGSRRREETGLADALVAAMCAAADRDDLEAMPNWTAQPQQSRFSYLNPLRKRMDNAAWQKILLLLLRQRATAGDRGGVAWCLYSYKYEFPDSLVLIKLFCDMSVSARQTTLRATFHCTRDERRLFRPLWAESLRDPAAPVVLAGLNALGMHHARSLRPLVAALASDEREDVAAAADELLQAWAI